MIFTFSSETKLKLISVNYLVEYITWENDFYLFFIFFVGVPSSNKTSNAYKRFEKSKSNLVSNFLAFTRLKVILTQKLIFQLDL